MSFLLLRTVTLTACWACFKMTLRPVHALILSLGWTLVLWKQVLDLLGIRDLTKIRCGIRENAKDLAGIRDLTATREAGFPKIWARDAGFCCLSVGNSGNRHDPNKRYSGKPGERKISIERANLRLKFISFCRN